MKKIIILILLSVFLVACSNESETEKLDEETKSTYLDMTKDYIEAINEGGIRALEEAFSKEVREAFKEDSMNQLDDFIKDKGNFLEFGKGDALKTLDKSSGLEILVTQQEAIYERGTIIYTVNYDGEDMISGFFIK